MTAHPKSHILTIPFDNIEVYIGEYDILWFDVAMDDVTVVQVHQPLTQLTNDEGSGRLA